MVDYEVIAPRTEEETLAELRALPPDEVRVLAGGTDLLFDLEFGRSTPRRVISLRRLPWRTLDWSGGSLTIGSTLPIRALETDPDLPSKLPGLYQAVQAIGGVALRNRATVGGNLGRAAPASDLIPMLLALDAVVELVSPTGTRTVPVDRFVRASRETVLGRAELIRSIRIPECRPSAYLWQRVRPVNDISQVSVAVAFSPTDALWRVALGGTSPRPMRADDPDHPLAGTRPSETTLARFSERLSHHPALFGDRRASDEYRRRLVGALFLRAMRVAMPSGGSP
jgi:carbon-monoxide dehydrogenase medium subunit